jgi:hypothetical protein
VFVLFGSMKRVGINIWAFKIYQFPFFSQHAMYSIFFLSSLTH